MPPSLLLPLLTPSLITTTQPLAPSACAQILMKCFRCNIGAAPSIWPKALANDACLSLNRLNITQIVD